ncbi:hypothetical protein niasHT_011682 [Heterodera trifolii]|uniref:Uncharacterized protein n=1 Tax=Heterodera trifolii TaxID=157864 RepID=A0ABD2L3N7_9BILA
MDPPSHPKNQQTQSVDDFSANAPAPPLTTSSASGVQPPLLSSSSTGAGVPFYHPGVPYGVGSYPQTVANEAAEMYGQPGTSAAVYSSFQQQHVEVVDQQCCQQQSADSVGYGPSVPGAFASVPLQQQQQTQMGTVTLSAANPLPQQHFAPPLPFYADGNHSSNATACFMSEYLSTYASGNRSNTSASISQGPSAEDAIHQHYQQQAAAFGTFYPSVPDTFASVLQQQQQPQKDSVTLSTANPPPQQHFMSPSSSFHAGGNRSSNATAYAAQPLNAVTLSAEKSLPHNQQHFAPQPPSFYAGGNCLSNANASLSGVMPLPPMFPLSGGDSAMVCPPRPTAYAAQQQQPINAVTSSSAKMLPQQHFAPLQPFYTGGNRSSNASASLSGVMPAPSMLPPSVFGQQQHHQFAADSYHQQQMACSSSTNAASLLGEQQQEILDPELVDEGLKKAKERVSSVANAQSSEHRRMLLKEIATFFKNKKSEAEVILSNALSGEVTALGFQYMSIDLYRLLGKEDQAKEEFKNFLLEVCVAFSVPSVLKACGFEGISKLFKKTYDEVPHFCYTCKKQVNFNDVCYCKLAQEHYHHLECCKKMVQKTKRDRKRKNEGGEGPAKKVAN